MHIIKPASKSQNQGFEDQSPSMVDMAEDLEGVLQTQKGFQNGAMSSLSDWPASFVLLFDWSRAPSGKPSIWKSFWVIIMLQTGEKLLISLYHMFKNDVFKEIFMPPVKTFEVFKMKYFKICI